MILLLIRCNTCGAERIGAWKRPHVLRSRLAARGWKHVEKGGKDYCPECVGVSAQSAFQQTLKAPSVVKRQRP